MVYIYIYNVIYYIYIIFSPVEAPNASSIPWSSAFLSQLSSRLVAHPACAGMFDYQRGIG